jgi:hypothetical protein
MLRFISYFLNLVPSDASGVWFGLKGMFGGLFCIQNAMERVPGEVVWMKSETEGIFGGIFGTPNDIKRTPGGFFWRPFTKNFII